MWLTKQLRKNTGARVWSAQVEGGEQLQVQGESEYRSPETMFPYGFNSLAAGGQRAVMLDGMYVGISALPDNTLQEGEVRLFSSGGAEILLKRNGQVVINGQVFEPKN